VQIDLTIYSSLGINLIGFYSKIPLSALLFSFKNVFLENDMAWHMKLEDNPDILYSWTVVSCTALPLPDR
jgi:hypothetical protein